MNNSNDQGYTRRMYENLREAHIIQKLVTKDDYVLDIGACIGEYTQILAHYAKYVYAFEPSPTNFKELEKNTKDLPNVYLYNVAVSNENGEATLYMCPTDIGMNRLYYSQYCVGGDRHTVKTVKLDSIIISQIEKVKFIKMDIEGFEYYALQGMRLLLEQDRPYIMMEFHPPSILESGTNPEDIYNLLRNELGYGPPMHCYNNGIIPSYEKLFENTNNTPALNILWTYNNNSGGGH